MSNTMRNVPEWAKVSKSEYRDLRNTLKESCANSGFEFIGVWNLMIEEMEERHALVAKGRRKTELTLAKAVAKTQQDMVKERIEMRAEADRAAEHAAAMTRMVEKATA